MNFTSKGKYIAPLDAVGINEISIDQVPGTTIFTAKDLCTNATASGDNPNEAFENLQKANPGKKYKLQEK